MTSLNRPTPEVDAAMARERQHEAAVAAERDGYLDSELRRRPGVIRRGLARLRAALSRS